MVASTAVPIRTAEVAQHVADARCSPPHPAEAMPPVITEVSA